MISKLLYAIVFFMPYTIYRIAGFKISEVFTLLMIVFIIMNKFNPFRSNRFMDKFAFLFIATILFSGILSYIDPINQYVSGEDDGIYYSFEYGWIFKIFRMLIVLIFAVTFERLIKRNMVMLTRLCNIYITSNVLLDTYAVFLFLLQGVALGRLGIYRTSLAAAEPSEAGFINCFAVLTNIFLLIRHPSRKYRLSLFILILGQLVIGSTTSIVATCISVGLVYLVYEKYKTRSLINYSIKLVIGVAVILLCFYMLGNYTNILGKFITMEDDIEREGASTAERLTTITTSLVMFRERFILGVGFGNFGWYISHFITSPFLLFVPGGKFQPNNLYFQLLAELGIVGFSVYIWASYMILRKSFYLIKVNNQNSFAYLILCLEIYLLIHSVTLPTLFSFQFWIVMATVQALYYNKIFTHEIPFNK